MDVRLLVLWMDEILTLERTWGTENPPDGKLPKFNSTSPFDEAARDRGDGKEILSKIK